MQESFTSVIQDDCRSRFPAAMPAREDTKPGLSGIAIEFMLMAQYFFSRKNIYFNTVHASMLKIACKYNRQVLTGSVTEACAK